MIVNRRHFTSVALSALGGLGMGPLAGRAAGRQGQPPLFCASVGATLFVYRLDAASRSLRAFGTPATVPAEVQCCWSHPARHTFYVACSKGVEAPAGQHFLSAFRLMATGDLEPLGPPVALRARPIYVIGDHTGAYLLTAYNRPSALTVHTIRQDGSVGEEVPQAALETGIYPHEVRVFPSNRAVLLMSRGNQAARGRPEDPGALEVFDFAHGRLRNEQVVAPDRGYGFRPRHADFHPSGRWVYVDLESQNVVHTYRVEDDRLSDTPLFITSTLERAPEPGQMASEILVHPNGRTLYVANRDTGTVGFQGERVSNGGENSIAVFSLDPVTGKPARVQSVDARGFRVRTMDLSRDGRWLVAASVTEGGVRDGNRVRLVAAGLSLFSVRSDGRLQFASKHDIEAPGERVLWAGSIA